MDEVIIFINVSYFKYMPLVMVDDDAEEDGGEWCDVVDVGLFNESRG